MQPNIELETKVIKKFVEKNKLERYIWCISSDKNRSKFTNKLAHFNDFQWNKFDELKGDTLTIISEISSRLKLLKINSRCYIISEDDNLDGTTWEMKDIFDSENLSNGFGSILVFGNADLIYFRDEDHCQYVSKT